MKVSELKGMMLDYWVADAEGMLRMVSGTPEFRLGGYSPSTQWEHGGPIIDREIERLMHCSSVPGMQWHATNNARGGFYGDTGLIAAMRAYVASKYGEEVPDEPTEAA